MRHADGVADLQRAFLGEAGGDDVLGEVAADIGGRAIDLGRVLAAEGAPAMRSRAAVGIDNDLAPGQAAIAVRTTDHEAAGRVDIDFLLGRHPAGGQARLDDGQQHALDLALADALVVLGRDDDAGGAHRLAIDVAQRDLALGVGLEPGDQKILVAPHFADPAQDEMRVVERRRHQILGLAARIAEHDALVAGALILVAGGIDAHGDIGGLRMQMHIHLSVAPGEAGLVVADVMHRETREMGKIFGRDGIGTAGLTGEHDAVRCH